MKKILSVTFLMLISLGIFAQEITTLSFKAQKQNGEELELDSVIVTNLTKGWTEVITSFDTTFSMPTVGIREWGIGQGGIKLQQNYPNPFQGTTDFNLTLANTEKVDLAIFDINGKKVAEYRSTLPAGEHIFHATLTTPQTYLLNATTNNGSASIKMINMGKNGGQAHIAHVSSRISEIAVTKGETQNPFSIGDSMQYIGYVTIDSICHHVTLTQVQGGSETITFIFPTEEQEEISIVGSWTMSSEMMTLHYTFKEDGTYSLSEYDTTFYGTYTLRGDTLTMLEDTFQNSVRVILQYDNNVMTFRFADETGDFYGVSDDFYLLFRDSAKINAPIEDIQGKWWWYFRGDTSIIRASLIVTDTLFEFIIPAWREFLTGHIEYENGMIQFKVDEFKTRGNMGEINESPEHLYDNWHKWTEEDTEHGEDPTFGYQFSIPFIAHDNEAFSIFANLPAYFVKQK